MKIRNLRQLLSGPSEDPVKNELELYFLVRFKDKVMKTSTRLWVSLLERFYTLDLYEARVFVNCLEAQDRLKKKLTGEIDQETRLFMTRFVSFTGANDLADTFKKDQYSFRSMLRSRET